MTDTKAVNPKDAIASGKLKMLLSPIARMAWAVAQYCGAAKYGGWNWRGTEVRSSVYLDAVQRHAMAYEMGEELDPEDGTPHLGNIMACCAIILDAKAAGTLIDDRPYIAGINYREYLQNMEEIQRKLAAKYADRNPKHWTIEGRHGA